MLQDFMLTTKDNFTVQSMLGAPMPYAMPDVSITTFTNVLTCINECYYYYKYLLGNRIPDYTYQIIRYLQSNLFKPKLNPLNFIQTIAICCVNFSMKIHLR